MVSIYFSFKSYEISVLASISDSKRERGKKNVSNYQVNLPIEVKQNILTEFRYPFVAMIILRQLKVYTKHILLE